jgi:hypothetical protein
MLKLVAIMCLFAACDITPAQKGQNLPLVPAPTAIRDAKRVFLTNSRASDAAYNAFYSALEDWGRYQIVGCREQADLIVELAYRVGHGRAWLHDEDNAHPERLLTMTRLAIFDAKSDKLLWSAADSRDLALRVKNREKDAINSAQKLVEELKEAVRAPA